jgi:hypothetical protein
MWYKWKILFVDVVSMKMLLIQLEEDSCCQPAGEATYRADQPVVHNLSAGRHAIGIRFNRV